MVMVHGRLSVSNLPVATELVRTIVGGYAVVVAGVVWVGLSLDPRKCPNRRS